MNYILRPGLKARGIKFTNKHLIDLERVGKFPRRVRLGDAPNSTVAWIESEIDAWQAALAAARDQPRAA